eukprot:ANDGO_06525.mRNA.1 thymidylate synthase
MVNISQTFYAASRSDWRGWLQTHHASAADIWLVMCKKHSKKQCVSYDEAVEEAICFGWIDTTAKSVDCDTWVQRYCPRRAKSSWSELNKERARRLVQDGLMTEAGSRVLPDLSLEEVELRDDVKEALQCDPCVWASFCKFPLYYRRIRVGFVESARTRPEEFQKRLDNFIKATALNRMIGTHRFDTRK